MSGLRVVVVGAGIGGLTAAIALARDGHDVQVVERARRMTATGAGIGLWPNAIRALEELGLGASVRAVGHPFAATRIRDVHGRVLSSFDPGAVLRRLQRQPLIAHRADLQAVLVEAAADVPLRLAAAAAGVSRSGRERPRVGLSTGEVLEADLVVGADGVRSVVRRSFDGSRPRTSRLLSWRAVVEAGPVVDDAWLSIGHGHQFLATPMTGGRTYLAGLLGAVDGRPPAQGVGTLRRAHDRWHQPIPTLVSGLADAEVRWDAVVHRPAPRTFSCGPVVLIGDAAHPMTPDLGQGGCQAIEDAVLLSEVLRRHPEDIAAALQQFDRIRRRRVRRVVNDSRRIGRVLAIRQPAAAAVRNRLIPIAPDAMGLAQLGRHASARSFERGLARTRRRERTPDSHHDSDRGSSPPASRSDRPRSA